MNPIDPQGYQPFVAPDPSVAAGEASLFVVIAYVAIWLVLLIFVASVWQRQRQVRRELELLRQQLEPVQANASASAQR